MDDRGRILFAGSAHLQEMAEEWQRASKELQLRLQQTFVISPVFSELAKISAEASATVREMFERNVVDWSRFQQAISANILTSEFQEQMARFGQQWKELLRQCAQGAERLGKSGWTLPVHMSAREMYDVLQENDNDALDKRFIAFYHDGNEIPFLKRDLLDSVHLARWHPLLEQCFENYETGKHLICIPALLTALEGAIDLPVRHKQRIAFLEQKIAAAPAESLDRAMWLSIVALIGDLYEPSEFGTGVRPLKLNRHWVLHGRDVPEWRQADALRLFHALAKVCSVFD